MVGDLRDYAQALTRHANGYMTHAIRQESPSRLSAAVNARHLEEVPERDPGHLADQIEDAVSDLSDRSGLGRRFHHDLHAERSGHRPSDDDRAAAR